MSIAIRPATPNDIPAIAKVLVQDAQARHKLDPVLWKLAADPQAAAVAGLKFALENDAPPFRHQWLMAEHKGAITGITHSILLPVPPIYAGEFGPPGLIMDDCYVTDEAPSGTRAALLKAAEDDLVQAGAQVLLAASVDGGAWAAELTSYAPLTLYFSKTDLHDAPVEGGVRPATEADIADIIAASARNRRVLHALDPFWKPHAEADARFEGRMRTSLGLADRDMLISAAGYTIAQPATALHFPAAHAVSGTGFIDDYFHNRYADPADLDGDGTDDLLSAAEAALARRGNNAVLLVCPAAWHSKIALLEAHGYACALTWFIKRQDSR